MKRALFAYTVVAAAAVCSYKAHGGGSGTPLKYISSCEIDLNGDKESDIALLVETVHGTELIVLLRNEDGYNTFVLSNDKPDMHLSCNYGKKIKETQALSGEESARTLETPGAYLQLAQPEGAALAFFWNGSGFSEVWTAD